MEFDVSIFWEQLFSLDYVRGALLAIGVAVLSLILGILIGFVLALWRMSRNRLGKSVAGIYIWFFRAIPALLLLLIVWNALPQLVPFFREDWFTPFIAAFIALGIVEAAYMAEIIRSALLSVDDGQALAGRAIGLSPGRVMWKVIIPQAARIALPPVGNEFIGLIKYTSLASVISLRELLTTAQVGVNITFRYAEYYSAAIIYYLVIVTLLTLLQSWLERKFRWTSRVAPKKRMQLIARKEMA